MKLPTIPSLLLTAWSTLFAGVQHTVQVNTDAEGVNIPGDAANEPSITVDPTNPSRMAIGWRQFDTITSSFRRAGVAYSVDGGRTWRSLRRPDPFRTDPVLDSDADGNFYYLSLECPQGSCARSTLFTLQTSENGGRTWDSRGFSFGDDKQWMAIDRTGGVGQSNIYVAWNPFIFNCCQSEMFARSTDGGLSFEPPVAVPDFPVASTITVGPGGEVYVAGGFRNPSGVPVLARSTTARDPAKVPTFDLVTRFDLGGRLGNRLQPNPGGFAGHYWVATDHSDGPTRGHVYVLASVFPPGDDPLEIMFVRSTDGGQTFSPPVRVNDDPADTNAWQWFGTMSVAPNGRIDVVWNDSRATGEANLAELYYSFSEDAGVTWSENEALSAVWDSSLGWPVQRKIGDYYHMVSDRVGANLAWAATLNGEQDVYFTRIGEYDCNQNGTGDTQDILDGTSLDLNGNGIPDSCDPMQVPGDCNQDRRLDISDAICLLGALFRSTPARFPCGDGLPTDTGNLALLDWHADGEIGPSDALGILQFIFRGGPGHTLAARGTEQACAFVTDCGIETPCQ